MEAASADFAPDETISGIVERSRREPSSIFGGGSVGAPSSVQQVRAEVYPNCALVARRLQCRHSLSRSRTPFELVQVGLDGVRMLLSAWAVGFFLAATGLRVGGSLAGVVSGATAFTVVISVAFSWISFVLYLCASACDGVGVALQYMGSLTVIAKVRLLACTNKEGLDFVSYIRY